MQAYYSCSQQTMQRSAALCEEDGDNADEEGPEQPDSLGQVVVLSTAHSWNPQRLFRRSTAGNAWADAPDGRGQAPQQPPQHLHPQHSQQLPHRQATAKPTASKQSPGLQQATLTVMACFCWILASSGAILINKHIMVDLNFPYPATVGAIGMVGTSIITFIAVRALRLVQTTQKVSMRFYSTQVLPTGLFLALSMQLGNTAYLHLSVAFVQMLKAFTPVCTMLFAFLFQLERPSLRLIAAVGLITAGVTAASYGEGNFSFIGVAAMITSMTCEGLRLVMMQSMVSKRSFHPLEALLYLAPAASFWMLLFVGFTEAIHIHQDQHLEHIAEHPVYIAASAVAGFGVNAMAMAVISLASALTLKVLGICKDVGLVMFGVVILGEHVTSLQLLGYSISLVGLVWYNAIKAFGLSSVAAAAGQVSRGPISIRVSTGGGQTGMSGSRSNGGVKPSVFAKPSAVTAAKPANKVSVQ